MKRFLVLIFTIAACQPTLQKKTEEVITDAKKPTRVFTTPPVELTIDSMFRIEDSHEELDLDERTLWGKFHRNRVSFYIVEQPNLTLYGSSVESMTLYLIDSVLCRKKYKLGSDISEPLIRQLGKFVFKPMDWDTNESIKVVDVVLTNDNTFGINPILNRYELKWETGDKTILFRHEQDTTREINVYDEQLPEYKRLLRTIERDLL